MTTTSEIIVKILVPGCGFPNFTGTSTYIQLGDNHIIVDTSSAISRVRLLDSLQKIGIKCGDITHLFLTHMHMDHYGNLDLFQNAKIYLTPREDFYHQIILQNKIKGGKEHIVRMWKSMTTWKQVANSSLLTAQEDVIFNTIRPFTESENKRKILIGEGDKIAEGISVFICTGHSYGHLGLVITKGSTKVVIIGDGLPNKRWYDRISNNIFSQHKEYEAYKANFNKITNYGECIIIPGHDYPFHSVSGLYLNELVV